MSGPRKGARQAAAAPRHAVVVGAGGLMGRVLCERMRALGAEVVGATRDTPPLVRPDGAPAPALRGAGIVYHLATSVTPSLAETRPELVAADHEAFVALLDALALLEDPPLVVLTSTGLTVSESADGRPCTESAPARPRSAYARAKLALERELRARSPRVPGMVLRMTNVYGPGHRLRRGYGVVAHWLDAVVQGRPLDLYGDPDTTRDYLYVDDAVAALAAIGPEAAELPFDVINIGSGEATSLGRLLGVIRKVTDRELTVRLCPARGFDQPANLLDVERARRFLGWQARTPLAVGLERTWRALVGMEVAR
ncbi:NAD-dependent epimerase/dehydratase family protein [Streptomyces sp. SudanB182_2057]|uniref:NAD-dependent epimerase/dehydratase family protein n=1 Tax=Streptomyces sp. SudanB182_2057 TaxID=3035281 RepID=UPI003F5743B5